MSTWTAPSGRQDAGRMLQREPLAFTVLLNWNGWKDTVECLSSLQKLEYGNNRTIVVDNGSTNDSVPRIRAQFPQVEIIEMGKNLGFAGGCNAGIRAALERGAEYVWLLNNDTIVDRFALGALVGRAEEDTRIGAVGAILYYMDEPSRIQTWGGLRVNLWTGRFSFLESASSMAHFQYLSGASLLIKVPAIKNIGLLDDSFFMYGEDADYGFRLRRAGWSLSVAEDARVWHKDAASTGRKSPKHDFYFNSAAVQFFHRYARVPVCPIVVGVGAKLAKRVIQADWRGVAAVLRGLHDGWQKRAIRSSLSCE
jgi:GT2 family glycosyltransferase